MSTPATQEQPARPDDELPDLLPVERSERSFFVRVGLLVATVVLFVLGVVFWLIPVVTGVPFWILGFITLGMASRRAARWINGQERRLPRRVRLVLRPRLARRLRHDAKGTTAESPRTR